MALWCRDWWFAVIDGLSNQCVLLIGLVLLYYVVLIGCAIGVWYNLVSSYYLVCGIGQLWGCMPPLVMCCNWCPPCCVIMVWVVTPIDSGCFILGIDDSYVFGLFWAFHWLIGAGMSFHDDTVMSVLT